tara:strand:- start:452 stop:862 length:411 start_codon:yes stop_codon:yes gene_type:complete
LFSLISGLLSPVINGVSSHFKGKQEIKKAQVTGAAKLSIKKETGDQKIKLTDAEWESIAVKSTNESWKDEYVTIIITLPIIGVMAGAVWNAFTGNDRLLTGTLSGIKELNALGLNWDTLTVAVVYAAIGLKVWRAK